MNFVNVNRADLAALGTNAPENFLHFAVENICRDLLSYAEELTVDKALIVAETLSARAHPTDNDG
jgi:hypothetical protein